MTSWALSFKVLNSFRHCQLKKISSYPPRSSGRREETAQRLTGLAERLSIGDRLNHRPNQLSGGQRQRIAIARALINDPAVILADEPTGNLDSKTGEEVLELLRNGVDKENWTVVMVTHDAAAAAYADRIIHLQDGKISREDVKTGVRS